MTMSGIERGQQALTTVSVLLGKDGTVNGCICGLALQAGRFLRARRKQSLLRKVNMIPAQIHAGGQLFGSIE
jgi:hypothetical protein